MRGPEGASAQQCTGATRQAAPGVGQAGGVSSRASCVAQAAVGKRVTPSKCTCRVPCSMTNATYSRVSDTAQSMWKKSTARIVAACARRKLCQRSSRAAGGGIRCERRILRMVPVLIRCPRRRSSW